MASGTATPPPRPAEPQPEKPSYEAFIEDRLRRTRRQVKGVDIVSGLIILLIDTLAYLLAAVVIDHWVISGGLGFWGRVLLLVGLLVGAGWYFTRRILMPLMGRINPVFAAYTIEQSRPSLKNSLINFLLLRGHRREVPQPVYQAIEQRAAADLSQIEIEAAVDRTHVIRLGYVLVGIVAVCGLYRVLSPKDPFSSAARVLWPWSDIPAPTRVTIEDVKPGDTVAFHGELVTVSAEVHGVDAGTAPQEWSPVALYYSTADQQTVNQKIPMTPSDSGYRHQYTCQVPAEELGLQQDVYYYLTAGDYTTRWFTIEVQTAPAILVDQVEYNYPAYTGFSKRIVKRQGDIRAIEGTEVSIRAAANRPIHSAKIDLGCTGLREVTMRPQATTATGRFLLRLDPRDPNLPEYDCYQLRFRDDAGRLNPRPPRHRIEVIRDLPPEIQLVDPQQEDVPLAEDGRLPIRVRAEDPDFALRKVVLRAECDGRNLVIPPMLDKIHQGEFLQAYLFEPGRAKFESDASGSAAVGLKAGDRVRYWAEAEDNKQPTPGRSATAQQWITIVKPPSKQPPPQRPDGAGQDTGQRSQGPGDQPPPGQPDQNQPAQQEHPQDSAEKPPAGDQSKPPDDKGSEDQGNAAQDADRQQPPSDQQPGQKEDSSQAGDGSGKSDSGTAGQDKRQPSEGQSGQTGKPIDPETQDGDAFEQILRHRQKEKEQENQAAQQPGAQPSGDSQEGGQKPGDKQPSGHKAGDRQSGDQQPGGGQADQQGDRQSTGDQQPRNQTPGDAESGKGRPDKPQEGARQPPDGHPGGETSESPQGVNPQAGSGQGGDQQAGKGQEAGSQGGGEQQGGAREPRAQGAAPQNGPEENPNQRGGKEQGGEGQGSRESPPGAGKPSADQEGPPAPQGPNQDREKTPGEPGQNPAEQQPAQSPSISRHQSDSQGETSGDRSGGGEKGGGQRSNQPGAGAAGSQTEADQGGSAAARKGNGPTGMRGGNQVETDRQTGSSATRRGGPASGGREQPGGIGPGEKKGDGNTPAGAQRPQENPRDGGQPGNRASSGPTARGQGNPTVGGQRGGQPDGAPPPDAEEPGGEDPNLDYARRATDLALEHLKDQMEQGDSELLDRLGWTREEARKFIQKWEQMKRAAAEKGPEGQPARRRLDRALESLGLRPRGTQIQGGGTGTDRLRGLREAGRFDPPSDWAELFRAYTRGVAGGGSE